MLFEPEKLASVKVSREPGVWVVTIDRPFVGNALDAAANRELAQVFDAFVADDEARVAILTGAGTIFCSGHDYAALDGRLVPDLPETGFGGLTRRPYMPKVVIGAVNGDALDEGFELALACDLVVANESARLSFQQALWGRAPTEGGVHRLVRQIPIKKAMGALLTATPITASEAVLLGLVNEMTRLDQVVPVAREWAARVQRLSPPSVKAIKQSAARGLRFPSAQEAMETTYPEVEGLLASQEYASSAAMIRAAREGKG